MQDINDLLKNLPPLDVSELDGDAAEILQTLVPLASVIAIGVARALVIQNGGLPAQGRGVRYFLNTPDGKVRISIELMPDDHDPDKELDS